MMDVESRGQADTQGAQGSPARVASSEPSLSELLQQLSEGNEQAAAILVDQYAPHVRRTVRASLPQSIRSKVDSVDLVNTLLGALLIKRTYLRELTAPDQLLALLTKAAKDRVVDEYRKYVTDARDIRKEETAGGVESDPDCTGDRPIARDHRLGRHESTPSTIAAAREKWQALLASLSDRDREIVILRSKGLSSEQIAQRVKLVSARTVRRVLNDTMEKLLE